MSKKEAAFKVLSISHRIGGSVIVGIAIYYILQILRSKKKNLDAVTNFYESQARFTNKMWQDELGIK